MKINEVAFVKSSKNPEGCPKPDKPEYAIIGRSNVGKSSILNMLAGNRKVAHISSTPGKTRLINHFVVDNEWYLVDLPGYGYAKTSKKSREEFRVMIENYLIRRKNLICLFVLIDSRHEPQKIDLEFIEWIGKKYIPFVLCFTKSDKLTAGKLKNNVDNYKNALLETWESLPEIFITSAIKKTGREEILSYIEKTIKVFH